MQTTQPTTPVIEEGTGEAASLNPTLRTEANAKNLPALPVTMHATTPFSIVRTPPHPISYAYCINPMPPPHITPFTYNAPSNG